MSWFKHTARPKTPPKLRAHHTSPSTEKQLNDTKLKVSGEKTKVNEHSVINSIKKKK